MNPLARALAPALCATLLLPAPAFAADDPAAGVAIHAVGPTANWGGYPTISWGWNGFDVHFTDTSPRGRHRYQVTVIPTEGGEPVTASWKAYRGWDGDGVIQVGTRADFSLDTAYQVTVSEHAGDTLLGTTEPSDYLHEAVGHPERAVLDYKRAGRKKTVKAGSRVRVKWTGSWEEGTSLTQVIYGVEKDGSFRDRNVLHCEGSWCPTRKGVRWVKGGDEPLRSFRVPKRLAGKKLIVVTYGSLSDKHGHRKAQWGWKWRLRVRKG